MSRPRRLPTLSSLLVLLPFAASAAPGQLEINATCAVQTGCFAGDAPGYPVTISAPGAYRLTSSLVQTEVLGISNAANGIEIVADGVDLDLAGFTIGCANPLLGRCSGSVVGISTPGPTRSGIRVSNGRVDGMSGAGIDFEEDRGAVLEDLRVTDNGGDGLRAGFYARIARCTSLENGGDGIAAGDRSSILQNVAESNDGNGIATMFSVIADNVATGNGGDGIAAINSVIRHNALSHNEGDGIDSPFGSNLIGNTSLTNRGFGIVAGSSVFRDNQIAANDGGTVSGGVDAGGNACGAALSCP
ncbi:MAG: right-handed parallel beta-helix repeat-containing protein [Myxococcota bacterium]